MTRKKDNPNHDPIIALRVDADAQESILKQAELMCRAYPERELTLSAIVRALLQKAGTR